MRIVPPGAKLMLDGFGLAPSAIASVGQARQASTSTTAGSGNLGTMGDDALMVRPPA
jgi:hypothetical protein